MPSRATTWVVVLSLALASCGDVLGGVGELSRRVVHGRDLPGVVTTTTPVEAPALRLKPVTGLAWSNDGIDVGTVGLDRDALIVAVWRRGNTVDSFVQATRREIAIALPGIEFPRLVPESVTHVSSQLIFDQATGTLDVANAAAFGMWIGPPYEAPRSTAQMVVLRVGLAAPGDDGSEGIQSFRVTDGREMAWTDGGFVYQLFCRTGVTEAACFEMAGATVTLSTLVAGS